MCVYVYVYIYIICIYVYVYIYICMQIRYIVQFLNEAIRQSAKDLMSCFFCIIGANHIHRWWQGEWILQKWANNSGLCVCVCVCYPDGCWRSFWRKQWYKEWKWNLIGWPSLLRSGQGLEGVRCDRGESLSCNFSGPPCHQPLATSSTTIECFRNLELGDTVSHESWSDAEKRPWKARNLEAAAEEFGQLVEKT